MIYLNEHLGPIPHDLLVQLTTEEEPTTLLHSQVLHPSCAANVWPILYTLLPYVQSENKDI